VLLQKFFRLRKIQHCRKPARTNIRLQLSRLYPLARFFKVERKQLIPQMPAGERAGQLTPKQLTVGARHHKTVPAFYLKLGVQPLLPMADVLYFIEKEGQTAVMAFR